MPLACLCSLVCQAAAIYGFLHKLGLIALFCEVSFIICSFIVCIKIGKVTHTLLLLICTINSCPELGQKVKTLKHVCELQI